MNPTSKEFNHKMASLMTHIGSLSDNPTEQMTLLKSAASQIEHSITSEAMTQALYSALTRGL